MRYANKFLLSALFCILCCCKREDNSRYKAETVNFNDYLKSHFNKTITNDSTCYFLVSESGCSGCIYNVIDAFAGKRRVIFIMSIASYEKYSYKASPTEQILIDSTGKINRLPYHNGNIGLIETSKERIDTIIYFEPTTLEDQLKSVIKR
jgi:hypothetical protein